METTRPWTNAPPFPLLLGSLLVVGLTLAAADTSFGGGMFCVKRSGMIAWRTACQRREVALNPQQAGLTGPAGPQGPAGPAGVPDIFSASQSEPAVVGPGDPTVVLRLFVDVDGIYAAWAKAVVANPSASTTARITCRLLALPPAVADESAMDVLPNGEATAVALAARIDVQAFADVKGFISLACNSTEPGTNVTNGQIIAIRTVE